MRRGGRPCGRAVVRLPAVRFREPPRMSFAREALPPAPDAPLGWRVPGRAETAGNGGGFPPSTGPGVSCHQGATALSTVTTRALEVIL